MHAKGEKLSDSELYKKCREYGGNARLWQKKFASLLPEVRRRRLYKKYGFYSLYEFAAKLCGMSNSAVDAIMQVHEKLEDKPVLRALMAEQGWGKLKVVAHIATPETQNFWPEKVQQMSKSTLQTFIKEIKKNPDVKISLAEPRINKSVLDMKLLNTETGNENQVALFTEDKKDSEFGTGSGKPKTESQKSTIAFKLNADTEVKLRIFKKLLEKKSREPQDWDQVIQKLLQLADEHKNCTRAAGWPSKKGRQQHRSKTNSQDQAPRTGARSKKRLAPNKEEIQKSLPEKSPRYIPAKVRRYLITKYEGKCSYPGCKLPAEIFHHTRRFALVRNHDPDYLKPLCTAHERLAHHGLVMNEETSTKSWRIRTEPDRGLIKYSIDRKVLAFRRGTG